MCGRVNIGFPGPQLIYIQNNVFLNIIINIINNSYKMLLLILLLRLLLLYFLNPIVSPFSSCFCISLKTNIEDGKRIRLTTVL